MPGNDGELIIVDDDGGETGNNNGELLDGDEEITYEYNGVEESIRRGYNTTNTSFSNSSRCYTSISRGQLSFGDRNIATNRMTNRCTIWPVYSNGYYGIACDASKIDIRCWASGNKNYVIKLGSYVGATGYLQVITKVWTDTLVHWTIERLPFKNGICIAER